MKNPFTDINWSQLSLTRLLLVAIVVVLGLTLVFTILSSMVGTLSGTSIGTNKAQNYAVAPGSPMMDSMYAEEADMMAYGESVGRGIAPEPPIYNGSGGLGSYDETAYETVSYNAYFKTSTLDTLCDSIELLKPRDEIVFEQQSRGDRACYYTFKVEHENADDIATWLQDNKPEEFTVSSEVVKKQLVRYESQLDILLQKQTIIEDTLDVSLEAYDELTALATREGAVTPLASVIDSKLKQVERLTLERVNLAQQIDSLAKRQAELLDRIEYAYFTVRVEQYVLLDATALKNSWVYEMQKFVRNVNTMAQALTLHLIENLLAIAQLIIYIALFLVLAKFGWRIGKRFWQR